MKKYWHGYTLWVQHFLTTPARIVIWFGEGIIQFLVFPFIWLAVYGARTTISNISRTDILIYYILVAIITTSVQSLVGTRIRREIVAGKISMTLVKPYHYLLDTLLATLAYKGVFFSISVLALLLVYVFAPSGFLILPKTAATLVLFLVSLAAAFIISHFIQLLVGMAAFWLGENTAIRQMISMTQAIFSGELAPLVFYPVALQTIAHYSPFPYMLSFPIDIYLGHISNHTIALHFLAAGTWIIALYGLTMLVWHRGLRKHEGAGL